MFGIVLALGILAMTIGLIRSETAGDLRTLAATGASGWTRRTLTAATAGALGLAGAVLGTVAAYIAAIGYSWDNQLDGLSELTSVPTRTCCSSWWACRWSPRPPAGCSRAGNQPPSRTSRWNEVRSVSQAARILTVAVTAVGATAGSSRLNA